MIESGSLTSGVDPSSWGVPAGSALRIEQPACDLQPFVTEYTVSASDPAIHAGSRVLVMPGWPIIRLALTPDRTRINIGPRRYDTVPPAILMGTGSRTAEFVTYGGTYVMLGITPLGWSRLFRFSADRLRDRVVALDEVIAPDMVGHLLDRVHASDLSRDLPGVLDDFCRAQLVAPSDKEATIRGLTRIIVDASTEDIATASEMLGLESSALRRLSTRFFGFPPKLLLVRARFVQSMLRLMLSGNGADYSGIAQSYFDKSHFLRDAHRFLSTTPRRFMQHDQQFMTAFFRAQRDVFGRHPLAAAAGAGTMPVALP